MNWTYLTKKSGTTVFATDESGMKELQKLEGFARENHAQAADRRTAGTL